MLKTVGKVFVLVILVVSLAYLAYWRIFIFPESRKLTVTSIHGDVQRLEAGRWRPAQQGESLRMRDGIRTGPDSEAILNLADDSRVKVSDESELSVKEISEAMARFRLHQGKIQAEVKPSEKRQFEVDTPKGDGKVATRGAVFTMVSTRNGVAAVAAQSGEVRVSSRGEEVKLSAGNQSQIIPGEVPRAAAAIPATVFLKVDWPPDTRLNVKEIYVRGKTAIGSRIEIAGQKAEADSRGDFILRVPLHEGDNLIRVETEDVVGNRQAVTSPVILVDTQAPELKLEGKDLWK